MTSVPRCALPGLVAAALASACGGDVVVDATPGSGGGPASSSSSAAGVGGTNASGTNASSVAGAGGTNASSVAGAGGTNACVAACAAQSPSGAETFGVANGGCICGGCSDACKQAVCTAGALPSEACLPCVQTALAGDDCQNHEGLFDICTKAPNSDCHAFTICFQACGS